MDPAHPMTGDHSFNGVPHVVASLYEGDYSSGGSDGDRYVNAATIEPHLEQRGQEAPVIRVILRQWKGRELQYGEVLRPTLEDADELATALTFLVETAERA